MENMTQIESLETVTDLAKSQELWEEYSDCKTIYDTWDFRYRFAKAEGTTPVFLLASFTGGERGLLPLQYNSEKDRHEFFGGVYMEESSILPRDLAPEKKRLLYDRTPAPYYLGDIRTSQPEEEGLEFEEFKYIAFLEEVENVEQFVDGHFSGKSRNGLRKRLRIVREKGVQIEEGDVSDLDVLFRLNMKNFGDDSSFCRPERQDLFRNLLSGSYEVHVMRFRIQDQIGAVSLSLRFQEWYVYMNAGVDKEQFPNLGTFLIYSNVERAIELGCLIFDAGVEDLGWKERWHLEKVPLYEKLERRDDT